MGEYDDLLAGPTDWKAAARSAEDEVAALRSLIEEAIEVGAHTEWIERASEAISYGR